MEMNTEFKAGTGTAGIGEVLQANWIPLSLIGVGVAWLVAANTGLAERVAHDERVQAAGRKIGEIAGELGIGASSEQEPRHGQSLLGPDGEPLSRDGDARRGEGWVHQAAGAARGALDTVRDAGSAVLDRAGKLTDYAGDAGDLTKRASGQIAERLERDPWLIGIAGLVAGALVAAVIPPTRVEQEYIEETREGLWSKANELGHEAAERVRELADSTERSAKP
jgi:hypothetical protein